MINMVFYTYTIFSREKIKQFIQAVNDEFFVFRIDSISKFHPDVN